MHGCMPRVKSSGVEGRKIFKKQENNGVKRRAEKEMDVPCVISVSIYPGTITLTLIPFPPTSAARALVKPRFDRYESQFTL